MRVSARPVRLGSDWGEWRSATLEPGFRHDLEIKRRRMAKMRKPEFVLVQDAGEIIRMFDELRSFRAQRFKERATRDLLDNEAVFSFYRRIAVDGARGGMAHAYCLYLSGVPAAVMFGLVHLRTFYLILVGFDLARYRRLSLGLLAIEDTLRAATEAGYGTYDFTIGDYPWKTQFGAESTPLQQWRAVRTFPGYLAVSGSSALGTVKNFLRPWMKALPAMVEPTHRLSGSRSRILDAFRKRHRLNTARQTCD